MGFDPQFFCDFQAIELDSGRFASQTCLRWRDGASEEEQVFVHEGDFDTAERAEAHAQDTTRGLAAANQLLESLAAWDVS
jgi:hypothetical protein